MTNVEKWLAALAGGFQVLEDSCQQVLVGRDVNFAVGYQLTLIGKFVGRPRNGVTDDEIYRRYVRAQIRVNRSDGTPGDLLAVVDLVLFDDDATVIREERGFATVVYRIEGIVPDWPIVEVLSDLLHDAVSDGVRLILEWWTEEEEDMFEFSSSADAAEDDEDAGFADAQEGEEDYDAGVSGGALAGAID